MDRRDFLKNTIASATGLIVMPLLSFDAKQAPTGATADTLEQGFLNPPTSAKPQAYWMWMNGHITKEGITLDLETMQQMGLAGAFIYNTGTGIPKGPIDYGSAQWQEMVAHAMAEARRLGLELVLHNAPGYSSTGGPGVTPEMSMQQLVWTEKRVQGSSLIDVQLPQPFARLNYYKDALVVAFPSPGGETISMQDTPVHMQLDGNVIDPAVLLDGNPETRIRLKATKDAPAILQLQFLQSFEARAISISRPTERPELVYDDVYDTPPTFLLERSDDGVHYETVCTVSMPPLRYITAVTTQNFATARARYFRLSTTTSTWLSGVELHTGPRLHDWAGKVNFYNQRIEAAEQVVVPEFIIDPSTVVDVSDKLTKDGRLVWNAPAGVWTILRLGHTCIGTKNVSAPNAATGLEIDKFRKEAVDAYFDTSLMPLIGSLQSFVPDIFKAIFIDSYEVGKQNWTAQFPVAFKEHRNYDITPWAPALTGRIVKSVEATERFLWDLRQTHATLIAENYYGHFRKRCQEQGLKLYAQPYGDGVFDSLHVGQHLDLSLAEFWTRYVPGTLGICDTAVSIAHGYGKKVVAAEAFTGMPLTSRWTEYPFALKAQGDHLYSRGINRFVFHVFVHQPYTTGVPGMTMGPYGTHFDRNMTWIKQAVPWIKYLTRTQYLLQQGNAVADVCYFKGEDAASGIPDINHTDPPVPRTLAGDVIGPDVLLNRIHIEDGRILLPDGMQYSLMIMAPLKAVSLEILYKLRDLVHQGMILIVTAKPAAIPGLPVQAKAKESIDNIVNELWGGLDGCTVDELTYGKGKVFWNKPFDDVLNAQNVKPDFVFTSANQDAVIHYAHRRLQDTEIYFVSNHLRRREAIVCHFRVRGKQPEIWNAQSGTIYNAAPFELTPDGVRMPVELDSAGSLVVVFRNKAKQPTLLSVSRNGNTILTAKPFPVVTLGLYKQVANNFTITFWIKPDTFMYPGKGILIFPAAGEALYGLGHACCGLAAGQNGVRVFERKKGPNRDAQLMILTSVPLQGWTHVALRYHNGKPSLFLNGLVAGTHKGSGNIVHPCLQTAPTDELFSAIFEGNYTKPELYKEALTNRVIMEYYRTGLPLPDSPPPVTLFQNPNGVKAVFWKNGNYQFKASQKIIALDIMACQTKPLNNPWQVAFPEGSGAPSTIQLEKLISLHRHPDFNVRHFSGTAAYHTTFNYLAKTGNKPYRIMLDLGRVETIADVQLNGQPLDILWKEPYHVDVTNILVGGTNTLDVLVTTLWPNRMIGDAHLPAENDYDTNGLIKKFPEWYVSNKPKPGPRITFAAWNTFKKTDPLLESGLLGPVRLLIGVEKTIA